MSSCRVLIVDDHEATRRGIRTLLSLRPDWEICGEATDGIEAVEQATHLRPDVILMDISMPRMNGLDATRIIRRNLPDCDVVIVSQNDPSIVSRQAKEVNASGHVGKMELPHELIPTLDTILQKKNPQCADPGNQTAGATPRGNGQPKYLSTESKLLRHGDAEERLRLATEAAKLGLGIWYLDEDRVIWENDRPYEIFGRDPQEGPISGAEFREKFIDAADVAEFERAVAEMLQGDGRFFFRGRIKRPDDSVAWIELSGRLERRANGSPWRVLETLLDITEHKRREQELQEREERLRLAQKAARSATWDWNLKTKELITSPELQELFGFPSSEPNHGIEALRRVVAPDDLKVVDQTLLDAIESHGEYRVEFRITLPDGTLRWVESLAQVHYDEAGKAARVVGVSTDITQRKKVEERAREVAEEAASATAKFRAVFEQSSVFAGIMTLDGIVVDANRLSLTVCGYRSEDVLGKPFWETGWWRGSREVQEKIRAGSAQAAQGLMYRETLPYLWADGSKHVVELAVYPIVDDRGQIKFLHPTGIDVSERQQSEETSGLLAAIVDSSDDAIVSKNLDGIITSWNKGAERLFGHTAAEAIGKNILLIIPEERRKEETVILERLKRGERVDHFETVRMRKDRSLLDISLTISPVKDASGKVIGASKVARDVTEHKRIERILRESEERFRAIVETSPECVKLVAADGTLLHMNSSGLAMVGADRAELVVGKSIYNILAAKDQDHFRSFNERICRGGKGALEFDMVTLQGITRRMETHAAPLLLSDGTVAQLAVTRDITERTRAQEELRSSEEKLRTLAGELETQVRGRTRELEQRNAEILQQSEQLRDLSRRLLHAQDQERRHIARELHDSAGQIVTVLGMNLARIFQRATQEAPLVARDVDDCQELVQQLSKEIRTTSYLLYPPLLDETGLNQALRWYIQGLSQRSGLEITLDISENFGRLPREMELVVYRLVQECLTNIHRHSDSKNAAIRVSLEQKTLTVEIADTGKGIPAEKLDQLQRQDAGVGIRGMRERIRQFDGRMKIQSNKGGTTISFEFEIPQAAASSQDAEQQIQLPG